MIHGCKEVIWHILVADSGYVMDDMAVSTKGVFNECFGGACKFHLIATVEN